MAPRLTKWMEGILVLACAWASTEFRGWSEVPESCSIAGSNANVAPRLHPSLEQAEGVLS